MKIDIESITVFIIYIIMIYRHFVSSIADMLIYMIDKELPGADIYNFIDLNGFGIIRDPETNILRPAGLVFRLFSVMAGENMLDVCIDDNSMLYYQYHQYRRGKCPPGFRGYCLSAGFSYC